MSQIQAQQQSEELSHSNLLTQKLRAIQTTTKSLCRLILNSKSRYKCINLHTQHVWCEKLGCNPDYIVVMINKVQQKRSINYRNV